MAKMPDADRPAASTKRAGADRMLERPEGASVARSGSGSAGLPHTVRAAFTGLRHAGREVTRSKDARANRCTGSLPSKLLPTGDGHGRPTKGCKQGGASRLPKLDIRELREEWRRLYKADASPHLSRELLIRAVAYRMQEVLWAVCARSRSANCARSLWRWKHHRGGGKTFPPFS